MNAGAVRVPRVARLVVIQNQIAVRNKPVTGRSRYATDPQQGAEIPVAFQTALWLWASVALGRGQAMPSAGMR